ncbi:hypothetical protein DFH06DRAFT_1006264, partial [Mycena polygramma]
LASKDAGEAAAIIYTIQKLSREISPHFIIKSKRILKALTTDLESCEDKGWLEVSDCMLLKVIAAALRGQGSRCTLQEADERHNTQMRSATELGAQVLTAVSGQTC